MGLVITGVSHKTAPIELRERLAVPKDQLGAALDRLRSDPNIREAVVLSTCNRLEVYARPESDRAHTLASLGRFFEELYPNVSLSKSLYHRVGLEAVRHLFAVSAGLDSLVIGETEVLGQVKSAYAFAQGHGSTGKVTNVLFQRAMFVGKHVRNKTNISEGSSSVGSIAVHLAERIFGSLQSHRVLLLGAGKMAEVTARHLLSQKAGELVILNRTFSRADQLAKLLNGTAAPFEALPTELMQADIVICSASADRPLVNRGMVESLMKERRGRSLYFIDIAVPRNVDPAVHEIDNVYVYNIDDLRSIVDEHMFKRQQQIKHAQELVDGMANEFFDWLSAVLEGKERPLRHHAPGQSPSSTPRP